MNQYDVAGLLMTYSEAARDAKSTEKLKEIVRKLKRELNADEVQKMKTEKQ